MTNEPDLNFDIDALFQHMSQDLDCDMAEEQDWVFSLRSPELETLEKIGQQLESDFIVQLQETVEEVDSDGNCTIGAPLLSVVRRAALSADNVKQIASQLEVMAKQHGITYEGVSCYEPIDEEELFGWLTLDDAAWRLRHFTDCGLEDDADLPWTFLVLTDDLQQTQRIAERLKEVGMTDMDVYDEPDEEGQFGLCAFVEGRNNESDLVQTSQRIEGIAVANGGQLAGIQFYTRDDLNDLSSEEDDDPSGL